jgi:predicted RNase H-like nuclease (RuvC/YqgF family)
MFLKIAVPVYRKDRWQTLEKAGKIEVSCEADTLSEGYEKLKTEIEALMAKVNGETRLAKEAGLIQQEIDQKSSILSSLMVDIERAQEHYKNLKLLLESFGVDPRHRRLTFDTQFLLADASVAEVEVTRSQESQSF